jgi:hypothetical protein
VATGYPARFTQAKMGDSLNGLSTESPARVIRVEMPSRNRALVPSRFGPVLEKRSGVMLSSIQAALLESIAAAASLPFHGKRIRQDGFEASDASAFPTRLSHTLTFILT